MRNLVAFFLLAVSACHAAVATKAVIQETVSKKLLDSLVVPSGASITINAGASIINLGTATGFGSTGTVTSLSVVTANGISGTVANPTTTPAITLSLGAITPSSVAATGNVTGLNLSGTNTGDQTTITGNAGTATALQTARNINGVAFDGTASITVTAAGSTLSDTVPIAKGGTGSTTAADARTALGLGTLATQNANGVNITGGTVSGVSLAALSNLGIINFGTGAFDFSIIHFGTLTANRTLRFDLNNADRSISLAGTLTVSNDATISGFNTGDQTTITGNAGTATKLATGRTIAITGDLSYTSPSFDGSGNVTAAGTLATVNSSVGTFGSATKSLTATVNAKGLVTGIAEQTVTPAVGSITGLGAGVGNWLATPSKANLDAALGITLTTTGANTFTGTQTITQGSANAGILASTGYSLTGSSAVSMIDLAGTWNTTGVATAVKINIANTAAGSGSLLFDVQGNSKSVFSVSPTAVTIGRYDSFGVGTDDIHWNGKYGAGYWIQGGGNNWRLSGGLGSGGGFLSIDAGGANTVYLRNYSSPNTLQLGNDSGDTPTAQRIKAHDVTTGTGANLELAGGTGSVAGGSVKLMASVTTGSPVAGVTVSPGGKAAIGSAGTVHGAIKSGVATLTAGTVTISDSDVLETGTAATSSRIFVTRMTDGGTIGDSFSITRVNATSFTITAKTAGSTASSDTSTVSWLLLNP